MLQHIINILIVFELVVFMLRFIIPDKPLSKTYENVLNIILFCTLILIFNTIVKGYDIKLTSINRLFSVQEVKMYSFDEYIDIYRNLIQGALE